jgi:hypothetical protein
MRAERTDWMRRVDRLRTRVNDLEGQLRAANRDNTNISSIFAFNKIFFKRKLLLFGKTNLVMKYIVLIIYLYIWLTLYLIEMSFSMILYAEGTNSTIILLTKNFFYLRLKI